MRYYTFLGHLMVWCALVNVAMAAWAWHRGQFGAAAFSVVAMLVCVLAAWLNFTAEGPR